MCYDCAEILPFYNGDPEEQNGDIGIYTYLKRLYPKNFWEVAREPAFGEVSIESRVLDLKTCFSLKTVNVRGHEGTHSHPPAAALAFAAASNAKEIQMPGCSANSCQELIEMEGKKIEWEPAVTACFFPKFLAQSLCVCDLG